MRKLQFVIGVAMLLLAAACTTATSTPSADGPILTGFDALPKALATIIPSPTLDASPLIPTSNSTPSATPSPAPPSLTPTFTPNVGKFLGEQTYPALEGTFSWIPTHNPVVIFLTARPGFHPTAAPIAGNFPISTSAPFVPPAPGAPVGCGVPLASQFTNAYTHNGALAARLGCPRAPGYSLTLVVEPFQTGMMFWRETKEIYALSTVALSKGAATDVFFRVTDTWSDSLPSNDPGLSPPAGLLQPVRGFGYAWRNNGQIKNGLGWAVSGEQQYGGFWQDFDHGFMLTGNNGMVYALIPSDATTGQHFGGQPG